MEILRKKDLTEGNKENEGSADSSPQRLSNCGNAGLVLTLWG